MREEIAKDVYNFWLEYPFDKFDFGDDEIKKAWKSICKYQPKIEEKDGIKYVSNTGTSGSQIYRQFFPNIIKVRGENRPSIYDILKDKEKLWATVRNRIGNTLLWNDDPEGIAVQYPMNTTLSQICIGAKNSGLASMGSQFKMTVGKAIYEKYVQEGMNVLDYSCGFGSRLISVMSLQRKNIKYFGYEPNSETYHNLQNMIKYFDFNAEIKMCGSEREIFGEYMIDFVFSSPPYFNLEKYCEEPTQCYNSFPVYEDWLEGYWRQTLKNIKIMMKPEAVFSINIGGLANEFGIRIQTDMDRIIVEEGFRMFDKIYMKTSKSHLSGKRNKKEKEKLEGIYFYKLNKKEM
jgi:hypothetical protein